MHAMLSMMPLPRQLRDNVSFLCGQQSRRHTAELSRPAALYLHPSQRAAEWPRTCAVEDVPQQTRMRWTGWPHVPCGCVLRMGVGAHGAGSRMALSTMVGRRISIGIPCSSAARTAASSANALEYV